MTFSVLWTLLPAGYVPGRTDRLLLHLVASLRVADARPILGNSPLRNWPKTVNQLGPWHVAVQGESAPRPATVRSAAADNDLWQTIFATQTRVDAMKAVPDALPITPVPASFTDAAGALDALFSSVDTARAKEPTAELTADHPAIRAIHALAESPAERAARTDRASAAARAVADPIAAFARALRTTPGDPRRRRQSDTNRATAPLDHIPEVQRADFHQVVGMLLNHPTLAAAVGLRVTLEIAAFEGERLIRACDPAGRPFQGEIIVRQPWSRVEATPGIRRFVMATQRSHTPEIKAGMLDLVTPERAKEYVLTSIDVPGLSAQLEAHAQAVKAETEITGGRVGGGKNRMPVRHDAGLTLARRGRPQVVVRDSIERAQALADPASAAEQNGGAPVLYADDVTTGFRLDVSTDGGPYRSVMHRQIRYRVGALELTALEEGRIEGIVGVQQEDAEENVVLRSGEEVAAWDGWGLSVPRPGPKIAAQPGAPSPVVTVEPDSIPGYNIDITLAAPRGTLPRLRYGHSYDLRLRAVDLAGGSIAEGIDPAQKISFGRYLRHEAAPGPYVLPRRRYTFGESNERLVVREPKIAGPGTPDQACERHLAPPKASFALCELHGVFDSAFGPGDRVEARARMLTLARREQGSFLDPTVITAGGTEVPARGIAIITNDPARDPDVTLPIPRGSTLPNGAYVIHDTDQPLTPYLCDPIVTGVTLSGLGALPPVTATYRGSSWPDRQPIGLVVLPTSRTEPKLAVRVRTVGPRTELVVFVPPGFDGTFELSSAIDPGRLAELAVGGATPAQVTGGLHLGLSARQPLSVVHPVRKPLNAPVQIGTVATTVKPGGIGVTGSASYETHRATTGTVDVVATWQEHLDTGVGDVTVQDRRATVGSTPVDRSAIDPTKVRFVHDFGDTRHRRVDYRGVAATRFAEYFERVPPGDRSQQLEGTPTTVSIPNRSRPRPPQVHSLVPIFTHTTTTDTFGVIKKRRQTVGLRIYLQRTWLQTGENERLGVVLPRDTALTPGEPAINAALMDAYTSRWGSDPIGKVGNSAPQKLSSGQFGNKIAAESVIMPLVDQPLTSAGQKGRIISHAVSFDPQRRLWFADVALSITTEEWPFVRLALVRYQPQSVSGCHLSEIVLTDYAQLPPNRTVTAQRVGTHGVKVDVTADIKPVLSREQAGRAYSLRQERRMPDPLDTSLDLGTDAGIVGGWTVTHAPDSALGAFQLASIQLTYSGPLPPPQAAELKAGRIVVEETINGHALLPTAPSSRVTFTQTFDRSQIGFG